MKNISHWLFALSFISLIAGCETMQAQFAPARANVMYPARTTPEKIEVYRVQLPQRRFEEIGSVNACCGSSQELIDLLRQKASEMGGDAITGIDIEATGGMYASVIRYK